MPRLCVRAVQGRTMRTRTASCERAPSTSTLPSSASPRCQTSSCTSRPGYVHAEPKKTARALSCTYARRPCAGRGGGPAGDRRVRLPIAASLARAGRRLARGGDPAPAPEYVSWCYAGCTDAKTAGLNKQSGVGDCSCRGTVVGALRAHEGDGPARRMPTPRGRGRSARQAQQALRHAAGTASDAD